MQDKFGVFWYNDDEIFRWGDSDFERKASEFADAGINIVMTFSCTHFRWNYFPWFDKLNEVLARLVRACHKFNIRVVEHHSCHLTFDPRDKSEWDYAANILKVRGSSLDSFPGLRAQIASGDPEILPGVYLSSCRQIDGRTGDYARTGYHGYALCFNNPNYRKAYFAYLEKVYATGVDGIMTDDVHYFGFGHACACKHCREKFAARYGQEMPTPDQWGKFAGDYSNKVFVDFLRFRFDSTVDFQRAVTQHAQSLGLKLLRPNYTTSTFARNQTAYPFEHAGELWSHVFQENMFSSIMRASWPSWSSDAVHRSAMAKRYDIEAMSMFYPAREDDYYFCWALSRMWEHLLMATPEGGNLNEVEKAFYTYEQQHQRWCRKAEKITPVAFMQPRRSLDLAYDAVESSGRPLNVWLQGAVFRNLSYNILFEDEPLEKFLQYPMVVIAGATMLTDEQLELFKKYCQHGGKLLIYGEFGRVRSDGSQRKHPEKTFGFSADLSDFKAVDAGEFIWNDQVVNLPPVVESRVLSNLDGEAKVIAQSRDGEILGVSAMNGNLLWLAGGVRSRHPEAQHYAFVLSRWCNGQTVKATAPAYAADYLYDVPGAILQTLQPQAAVLSINSQDYQLAHWYLPQEKRYRLYLVNTAGLLVKPPAEISHGDIFKNFVKGAEKNTAVLKLKFNCSDLPEISTKVKAFSPEFSGAIELAANQQKDFLEITIPENTFAGFLEIEF